MASSKSCDDFDDLDDFDGFDERTRNDYTGHFWLNDKVALRLFTTSRDDFDVFDDSDVFDIPPKEP